MRAENSHESHLTLRCCDSRLAAQAPQVYEGEQTDVSVGGFAYLDRGRNYEMRYRSMTFYTSRYELKLKDGSFAHVGVPEDANIGT